VSSATVTHLGDLPSIAGHLHGEVLRAFDAFLEQFAAISRRAARRWGDGDWAGHQWDSRERLASHRRQVERAVLVVEPTVRQLPTDAARACWIDVRHRFARSIATRPDSELGETFFNSVTRRVFDLTEVDEALEFRWFGGIRLPHTEPGTGVVRTYGRTGTTTELFGRVLRDVPLRAPFDDVDHDAANVAGVVDALLARTWEPDFPVDIDVLAPIFYRNRAAYVVGRIRHLNRVSPLVLALRRTPTGTRVDAALLTENDISRVFGFTRAYFHVATDAPAPILAFVKSVLPGKPVAELYTGLGFVQHGKTGLYRALRRHLEQSSDRFTYATGTPGMVMLCFTLPSMDVVFKVIRDRFAPPKQTTAGQVKAKYELVFHHDRVGRMVDAQQFEHLSLPADRFDPQLLEELTTGARRCVELAGDQVVLHHVYSERRVTPLDVYLRTADPDHAAAAVLDYGAAIKDLAAANIFPGDLFPKNFGVTRHGTVVFYDYDELCLLSEVQVRDIPRSRSDEDELADQPWFAVNPGDVFPEEFRRYLRFPRELQQVFDGAHADLCEPAFWRRMQRLHAGGSPPEFFPYPETARFG
jgi:isocitrate dehydrogenase kinase/phosphatase